MNISLTRGHRQPTPPTRSDPRGIDVRESLIGTARTAGLLYLGLAIAGILGFLLIRPSLLGRRYLRAVRRADVRIGSVIAALESRPGLEEKTVVVVTSGHGGYGYRHNDPTRRPNYRVPFMVWGPGVAAGTNLYQLSSAYRSPGKRRPAYRALRQPVRNASVANLVTDLLDLPAVPGSTIGSRQDLNVFPR